MQYIILLVSFLLVACSGSKSSVAPANHTPFLEKPSEFSVIKYNVVGSDLVVEISDSQKASNYSARYGLTSQDLNQSVFCSNLKCIIPVSGQNNYYVQVTANNNAGETKTIIYFMPDPLHQISIDSSAATVTKSSATLTWTSPHPINSYSLWIGASSGVYTLSINPSSSPSTISSLRSGTNYFVQVRGVDSEGNVFISNETSVTTESCSTTEYSDNGSCVPQICSPSSTEACAENNGTGLKTCNTQGLSYGSCQISACDSGFYSDNGSCTAQMCSPGSVASCGISHGVSNKTCNSEGSNYGTCSALTCEAGYYEDNGACLIQTCSPNAVVSCGITNGTSEKTCNNTGAFYGSCSTLTCNDGFFSTGTSCDAFSITASSSEIGKVNVSWNSSGATTYTVKYGTTSSGLFNLSKSCNGLTTCVVDSLSGGTSYSFKVTETNTHATSTSLSVSATPLTTLSESFDFNNSLSYNHDAFSELVSGKATLIKGNTAIQKTNDGSGSGTTVFDNYESKSTNVTVAADLVSLNVGQSSGEYVSPLVDGVNNSVAWNQFNFKTTLPYGKELTSSTESGYGPDFIDPSANLIGLWHLNETSVSVGTSGLIKDAVGTHHGDIVTTGVTPATGVLRGGFAFDGNAGSEIAIPDADDLDATDRFTISAWVYPTLLDGSPRAIVSKRTSVAAEVSYSVFFNTGNRLHVDINDNTDRFSSNTVFTPDRWYFIVVTYNGTKPANSRVNLYVNGVLDKTAREDAASIPNKPGSFHIGTMNSGYNHYFKGRIDEVAYWKKEASLTEIQQIYQRGSSKSKIQIRTCSSASGNACSGTVTDWVGPNGTSSTYFTELDNITNPSAQTGTTGTTGFQKPWSLFTGGFTAWANSSTNKTNRFAQFKLILETSSSVFLPSFVKGEFLPQKYATSSVISSKTGINFKNISGVVITDNCGTNNRFDFSSDGTNYLRWSGSAWVTSDSTTANPKNVIEGLTTTNWNLFPKTSGKIYSRIFLNANGTSACEIDNILVNGTK